MKMRRFSLLFAAVAMMSMTAGAQETEVTTEAATEAAAEDAGAAVLSDDWADYQLQINDQVYQFPMMYEEFLAYGWTSEDLEGEELEPYQYSFYRFEKDDKTCTVYMLNLGKNVEPIENCIVAGISVDSYDWEMGTDTITLPGGIVRGEATVESIQEVYGTPSDTYEGERYTKLTYETDYNSCVEMSVYVESGVLEDIGVENFVEPEGYDPGTISAEIPTSVSAYEKPAALSEDPTAYEISVDGEVYALPVPVSVLVADGWKLVEDDSDAEIYAGYYGWVTLRKGGQEIHQTVVNNERYATVPQNCWIEELTVGGFELEAEGALPGGVTIGMTQEEFLAVLEENGLEYEVDESDSFTYYVYNEKEYDQCFNVTVYTKEDGNFPKDTVIEVTCSNAFE